PTPRAGSSAAATPSAATPGSAPSTAPPTRSTACRSPSTCCSSISTRGSDEAPPRRLARRAAARCRRDPSAGQERPAGSAAPPAGVQPAPRVGEGAARAREGQARGRTRRGRKSEKVGRGQPQGRARHGGKAEKGPRGAGGGEARPRGEARRGGEARGRSQAGVDANGKGARRSTVARRAARQAPRQPAADDRLLAGRDRRLPLEEHRARQARQRAPGALPGQDLRGRPERERALHRHRTRARREPARRLPREAARAELRGQEMIRLLLVVLLVPAAALAQGDEVIAALGGVEMRASEVRKLLMAQPPQVREQLLGSPPALDRLVRTELFRRVLVAEARAKGWDKRPEAIERMERAREQALVSSYVDGLARPPADYPAEADL